MKLVWITEEGARYLGDSNSYGAECKGNETAKKAMKAEATS